MRRFKYWLIRRRVRRLPQTISRVPEFLMRDPMLDSQEEE